MGKVSNCITMASLLSNGRKYSIEELSNTLEVTPRMVRVYKDELELMKKDEFDYFLKFTFEILNMNNRVAEYLIEKLSLKDLQELYRELNAKILIVTKGKKGVTYLFNNKQLDFELATVETEIDSNGAGDIFFASTIKDYIKNNLLCNETFINTCFQNASSVSKEVVKVIGARSYYQELYNVPETNNKCLCKKNY